MSDEVFKPFDSFHKSSAGYRDRLWEAYHLGFITEEELRDGRKSNLWINPDGSLERAKFRDPKTDKVITPAPIPLTHQRMEQIKIDRLLGLSE